MENFDIYVKMVQLVWRSKDELFFNSIRTDRNFCGVHADWDFCREDAFP